jgi:ADP-ribose pyrophosphatase
MSGRTSDRSARDTDGFDPADDPLRERLVSSEVLRKSRILEFRVDTIETPDGRRSTRDIAAHPGAVAVVAIDDQDRVLMVRQWRHATGGPLLEIPAGTLDRHPDGSLEDHAGAAARELEEETGSRASSWRHLAAVYTAPGFTSEYIHVYLATGLTSAHADGLHPDEDEYLELRQVPFAEALAMAMRGDIHDAKSMVGLLMAARLRESGEA